MPDMSTASILSPLLPPQGSAALLSPPLFAALRWTRSHGNTRHVLLALLALSNNARIVQASAPVLAQMAGMVDTVPVRKALRELMASGEITLVRRGRGHVANIYRVNVGEQSI